MGKKLAVLGIVLLIIGIIFAAAPDVLKSIKLDLGLEKQTQLIIGVVILIIGLVLIVAGAKR